jgi:DNA repair exonuclease SbcCD ATPase subunit
VALLLSLAELSSQARTETSWVSPIFFDEVFDSLDAEGREQVVDLVSDLAQDRCVVLVTHDDQVASTSAAKRVRVDAGHIS